MEDLQIIENIDEVITFLKEGCILVSSNGTVKSFFAIKKDKIFIQNQNCCYYLSQDEFINLYRDAKFVVYNDESSSAIDLEKDKEYYSWNPLKK